MVPILGYLSRGQQLQWYPSDGVSEDDPQHVDFAVGAALSRHYFGFVPPQKIGQSMGSKFAAVRGQPAAVKFSL